MTDVTITDSSGNVFTFADGELDSVRSSTRGDIEVTAFPGTGPANALGFDFNGVLKTISIPGKLFETTTSRVNTSSITTILEQKQFLEKTLNGRQTSSTFTSNYESQTYDGENFVNTK